jgi:hypothetical protein
MYVYIDESGSFAPAHQRGSWNCVAAYMSPEDEASALAYGLAMLRQELGVSGTREEIKRNYSLWPAAAAMAAAAGRQTAPTDSADQIVRKGRPSHGAVVGV